MPRQPRRRASLGTGPPATVCPAARTRQTIRPGPYEHADPPAQENLKAAANWQSLLRLLCHTFRVDEVCVWFEDWLVHRLEVVTDEPDSPSGPSLADLQVAEHSQTGSSSSTSSEPG